MPDDQPNTFLDLALADLRGGMVMLMAHLGDRLGLFRALATRPMTSAELACATGHQERYLREWLHAVVCAGYVSYDPATERFALPDDHVPVLVDATSPVFFGGLYHEMPALWGVLPTLMQSFREGGGVAIEDYDATWWDGMERFTRTWFENFLIDDWIGQADRVKGQLRQGAHVVDVGCGRGRALIKLAEAYPDMTAVGYDLSEANLEGARRTAREAGVEERLTFRKHDVHEGLPETFDVALTFDAVHDFEDPQRAFAAIHDGLTDEGAYLLLEFRVGDSLEENVGDIGAMLYAWSVTYCMTTSLAQGGKAVGTCGLPESVIRDMATKAGFAKVEVLPFDNPFNKVYVAHKRAA